MVLGPEVHKKIANSQRIQAKSRISGSDHPQTDVLILDQPTS